MKYKISFIFVISSILIISILSIIFYYIFSNIYLTNIENTIEFQYDILKDSLNKNKGDISINEEITGNLDDLIKEGVIIFVENKSGNVIASTTNRVFEIPFEPDIFVSTEDYIFYIGATDQYNLFVGKDLAEFNQTQTKVIEVMIIIILLFSFVIFFLSYFIADRALLPLNHLISKINKFDFKNIISNKSFSDGKYSEEIEILAKAFDILVDKIEEYVQREKEFLQDASHEFRTPIMGILSSVEILEDLDIPPKKKEKLDIIKYSAVKLQKITEELLFITRGEETKMTKSDINIGNYVGGLMMSLSNKAEEKNISLHLTIIEDFSVNTCEIYLQKLIGNLIQNAISYTPEGGTITITVNKNLVSIKDTGIGISQENIDKIWNRFFRNTTSSVYYQEGVGLGLSIVKKIINMNNWQIRIESELGKGTEFIVTFR